MRNRRHHRLRFWIKLPSGYSLSHPSHNFEFGTYTRSPSTDDNVAESSNGHFYHYLDLRSHGQWEQVIIDTHPDHQRGNSGNVEISDSPNPVSGHTYFDLMTRFYEAVGPALSSPARALRQAMLTTMHRYPEPVEWAAFVVIGSA